MQGCSRALSKQVELNISVSVPTANWVGWLGHLWAHQQLQLML